MSNKIEFKIPNSKKDYQFIGFDASTENSKFVFPCQYLNTSTLSKQEEEKIFKSEAKKIITLLKKFRQNYYLGGSNGELFQFYSMIWLIQDYIDHGYYKETEMISSITANGKINWKKTLKHNSILFNNRNIIYKELVRNKNILDDAVTITQIYKACLSYSVQRLGFIFGIDKTEKSVFSVESKNKDFLIYYLKNALKFTFNDYKKILITNLLAIITHCVSSNTNVGYSIFDKEFEYVFEFLVNKIFGTEQVKNFYNAYSYYLPEKVSAGKLRPDTIMKDEINKIYYIIDAKYYNFGYSDKIIDLPQSSSISKQIGYNHYLRDNLKNKDYKVRSVFLLPYTSTTENEYIKYVGYAKRDDNIIVDDEVAICLVDLKSLIDAYLLGIKKPNPALLSQILYKHFN